jgi:spore coat polysaccharide biosynthesis protein SpsF
MPDVNLVVVQARMKSTRLPGKILLDLAGRPLLARMLERLRQATKPDVVVIATTTDPADDAIADLCRSEKWECFRGHPTDLLDRHLQCARAYGATVVAKVPSDVPVVDAGLVDEVFALFETGAYDYVSNIHPATFPDGLDCEICSLETLELAGREATRDFEREHTTPFLWDNPDRFRIGNVATHDGVDYSLTHRWTIDYEEDYRFLQAVFDTLYRSDPTFSWQDLIAFLRSRPDIAAINAHLNGVVWYRHHLDELKHVDKSSVRQSPH